jgi:acetate kinase
MNDRHGDASCRSPEKCDQDALNDEFPGGDKIRVIRVLCLEVRLLVADEVALDGAVAINEGGDNCAIVRVLQFEDGGGPFEWLEKGIRRYGFHGTSFRWASGQAARLLKRENDPALRLIICHLGGGCSLAATVGGKSVDTTMGFTPMDGIAMCTRSGALDPGILLFLMRENLGVDKLEQTLDRESGLQGLSGLPGDTRILLPEADKGNHRAKLAMDVFVHRLQGGIGQMMASLGGRPDAIVFTDAIGEDEPAVRMRACEPFKFMGAAVDPEKNGASPLDSDISLPKAPVRVLIVKSREDWQIAKECHALRVSPI